MTMRHFLVSYIFKCTYTIMNLADINKYLPARLAFRALSNLYVSEFFACYRLLSFNFLHTFSFRQTTNCLAFHLPISNAK